MLAERLRAATSRALGSGEHLQIAGLLRDSTRIAVDGESLAAVRDAFGDDPWSFECHLDAIVPPSEPLWIEWPNGGGPEGGERRMTGCLLAPMPDAEGRVTVVTGWDGEGGPRHAFAVGLLDFEQLYALAFEARNRFSRVPNESLARILSCVTVSMPRGFADEIEIVSDGDGLAVEAAMRDAAADVPFLLALMVAMAARGGPHVPEGAEETVLPAVIGRGKVSRLIGRLRGPRKPVFARRMRSGRPDLVWLR